MPKEVVYDIVDCHDLVVQWDRDGYVQVGVVMKEPKTKDSPQNLKELTASWTDEEADGARGLFTTADRASINRAIRALRKARDQAFGKDE